jgi:murein DD-endopeptidase MepM/ murein hydrolase activator NlpD
MDFNPGEGAPIQIIADGVVSAVVQDAYGGLGYYVIVDHNVKGMKFQSVYGHMKAGSIQVRVGQHVSVTDIVGQVGSTGASTGAHLHFEIRVDGSVIDPLDWLQKHTN